MLKKIISILILTIYISFSYGQTPSYSPEDGNPILGISVTTDTEFVPITSQWQMMASVGECNNKSPFLALCLLLDTKMHLRFNFKVKFDENAYASWRLDSSQCKYEVGEDSTLRIYVFATRDPLLDVVSGDCWVWNSERSVQTGYADDLIFKKVNSFNQNTDQKETDLIFQRNGLSFDKGIPSWRSRFISTLSANKVRRFYPQKPTCSAADVRVRSHYAEGFLVLDFERYLTTPYLEDDIQIEQEKPVLLQVIAEKDGKILFYTPVLGLFTEEEFEDFKAEIEEDCEVK